ncbi:hypothetical protein BKA70DRAFT_680079 [Coprinopsis sp. MPI-PUGE-AT-0042]|nr:hypothetical protein BKA70DRAFT_680079 [Coprinopsis sp. MPI-PUGE-AT-0042]
MAVMGFEEPGDIGAAGFTIQSQGSPQIIVLASPSRGSESDDSEERRHPISTNSRTSRLAQPALSASSSGGRSPMRSSSSRSTTPITSQSGRYTSAPAPAPLPAPIGVSAPPGPPSHPGFSDTPYASAQPQQLITLYYSLQNPPQPNAYQKGQHLGQVPPRNSHPYNLDASRYRQYAESPPQPLFMTPPDSSSPMSISLGVSRATPRLDSARSAATQLQSTLSPSLSVMSAPGMASPPGGMLYRGYEETLGSGALLV